MSELSEIEGAARAESRAHAAARLVLGSELLPGPVPLPDFAFLMASRSRWRRAGLTLGAVGGLGAMVFAAVWTLRETAPISYVVDGSVAIADGVIDAAGTEGGPPTSVRFSEGTEVSLAPGARLRVVGKTARGAALALDRGRARFAVTRRSGASWSVASGPFTVDVIGTRFSLDWSPRDERLVVDLTAGSVQVRGASVGGPVAMHAGERLIATAADRRVTLLPLVEVQTGSSDRSDVRPDSRSDLGIGTDVGFDPGTTAAPGHPDPTESATAVPSSVRSSRRGGRKAHLALATPRRAEASTPFFAPVSPPARVPEPPAVTPPSSLAPSPNLVPQAASSMLLAAGGAACARGGAQYRFERMESGVSLPDYYTLAFSGPRTDHTHSWCGQGSLRVDATFNDSGRRNFFGRFAKETGQVVLNLRRPTDFTGKTVTVHFFVDGPADARFTAELAVVNRGRWVSGPASGQMAPGRWWTISHRFDAENEAGGPGSSNPGPFPVGGMSPVTESDRLGLAIHSTGGRRVWAGAVYVDDVGWR